MRLYNWHRFYDPTLGRYISADPTGQAGGANLYTYVENDPLNLIDPSGLKLRFASGSSASFKSHFAEAINYLNASGASKVVADLESESDTVYVAEATSPHDDYYDPATKTISWDPSSGLTCTNGGTQSPALGFLHEADHALGDITGTAASTAPNGTPYDTDEEHRVITGSETNAANKLGEPTRTDHDGTPVRVKCPGCTK